MKLSAKCGKKDCIYYNLSSSPPLDTYETQIGVRQCLTCCHYNGVLVSHYRKIKPEPKNTYVKRILIKIRKNLGSIDYNSVIFHYTTGESVKVSAQYSKKFIVDIGNDSFIFNLNDSENYLLKFGEIERIEVNELL